MKTSILSACAIGSTAFLWGLSPILAAPKWEKVDVVSKSKSLFGSPIAGLTLCPEAQYVLTATHVWAGSGNDFVSTPLPSAEPVSQGPFCIDGGILIATAAKDGSQRTFFMRKGEAWDNTTDSTTIYDSCCGKLATDGDRLFQWFPREIRLASAPKPGRPGRWTPMEYPFPDTILSVHSAPRALVVANRRADSTQLIRFKTGDAEVWSSLTADSLPEFPGAGISLLGLEGTTAILAVMLPKVRDASGPIAEYISPTRICFFGLTDGSRNCPEALDGGVALRRFEILGGNRYFIWFYHRVPRGSLVDKHFLFGAMDSIQYPFTNPGSVVSKDGSEIFLLDGSENLRVTRNLGATIQSTGTGSGSIAPAEFASHKDRVYMRETGGRWHSAGLKAFEAPVLAFIDADSAGMDSITDLGSDGTVLYGVNPHKLLPIYNLPTPAFSSDDGANWDYHGTGAYASFFSTSSYPVSGFRQCGENAFRIHTERFSERPIEHLFYREKNMEYQKFDFSADVWQQEIRGVTCDGANLVYYLHGNGFHRLVPGIGAQALKTPSGLPAQDPVHLAALHEGTLFVATFFKGPLFAADTSTMAFTAVNDLPLSRVTALTPVGNHLFAIGPEGIYHLSGRSIPIHTDRVKPPRGVPNRALSGKAHRTWYLSGSRWFSPDGRIAGE